ncbi:helix-turn-helix domain-containing protein [Agromyces bracchium]|uniref:Helix-turn-helix domain-containing protein n=1 Tax=Agromyces bracchium TaxID=88376 RepID=A0A6I3MAU2_9MICO|nr:helix-turn-helix transcriptional regulator [Agromyces bracchium]MTH70111.1 helix-turn-helix domain-containing protein [Agromyces bracchium]
MALRFRNLEVTPEDPVDRWGAEGMLAAIDRGGVDDWRKIILAIRVAPYGPVAADLEEALELAESRGSAQLLRSALEGARQTPEQRVIERLRMLAFETDMSQGDLAARIGTSRTRLNSYLSGAVMPSAALVERVAEVGRTRRSELV